MPWVRDHDAQTHGSGKADRGMSERVGTAAGPPESLDGLSRREREILGLMAAGRTNHSICVVLSLSPKTVESHVRSVFHKLGLRQGADEHRRVLAVLRYLEVTGTGQGGRPRPVDVSPPGAGED